MNKKKWVRILVAIVILSLLLLLPRLASEARAETRITITVAAGGVACGVFFFLHYAFRVSMSVEQSETETTAIFNLDPEGWKIRFPALNLAGSGHRHVAIPVHSPETIQLDVLKWRF